MSEHEGGDSKFLTGFLVGFLVGVLICLGVGGTFFIVSGRGEAIRAQEAMMRAEEAREMAERERARAEAERARAEKALKEKQDKKDN